jgi:hypothetical protein
VTRFRRYVRRPFADLSKRIRPRSTAGKGGMVLRNRVALAAAPLPEDETLTRKAVQLALGGDPPLRWPCTELILPPCHERTVIFALPLIESA